MEEATEGLGWHVEATEGLTRQVEKTIEGVGWQMDEATEGLAWQVEEAMKGLACALRLGCALPVAMGAGAGYVPVLFVSFH